MEPPGAAYYRDVPRRIPSLTEDQLRQLEVRGLYVAFRRRCDQIGGLVTLSLGKDLAMRLCVCYGARVVSISSASETRGDNVPLDAFRFACCRRMMDLWCDHWAMG